MWKSLEVVAVNSRSAIEYDTFIRLTDVDLVQYMEPVVNDRTTTVPSDMLARILSELSTYDEYHLVYALDLLATRSPGSAVSYVPKYLADERCSVLCAALRLLTNMPDEYVTQELIETVDKVLSASPLKKQRASILKPLMKRLRMQRRKWL